MLVYFWEKKPFIRITILPNGTVMTSTGNLPSWEKIYPAGPPAIELDPMYADAVVASEEADG